jgi:hypothetical protein
LYVAIHGSPPWSQGSQVSRSRLNSRDSRDQQVLECVPNFADPEIVGAVRVAEHLDQLAHPACLVRNTSSHAIQDLGSLSGWEDVGAVIVRGS